MPHRKARPLDNPTVVRKFLVDVLEYGDSTKLTKFVTRIVEAEVLVAKLRDNDTLRHRDYRDSRYHSDSDRQKLHEKIFNQLVTKSFIADEKKAKSGGLLPSKTPRSERNAYIVTGLPASGKFTIAAQIAEKTQSVFLDSDVTKRLFPEFKITGGADLLHEESKLLTFGDSTPANAVLKLSVNQYCIANGLNMVVQKVGSEAESLRKYRDSLIQAGYSVHLVLVSLDRKYATKRALLRYEKTKRYVPLSVIYDSYSNEPMLTYFRVKFDPEWKSVTELDNTFNKPGEPKLVYCKGDCFYNSEEGICNEEEN